MYNNKSTILQEHTKTYKHARTRSRHTLTKPLEPSVLHATPERYKSHQKSEGNKRSAMEHEALLPYSYNINSDADTPLKGAPVALELHVNTVQLPHSRFASIAARRAEHTLQFVDSLVIAKDEKDSSYTFLGSGAELFIYIPRHGADVLFIHS